MRSVSSAPMPASGSSSSSTSGAVARHIAISSWRRWPCDSVPAGRSSTSASPARTAASRAAGTLTGQRDASAHQAHGRGWRACAARRQFSITLKLGKSVLRW